MSELMQVTDGTFEDEIVNSDVPSMVDLWAPWCAPCRTIGPWIEELAQKYDGKFKAAKMNVDENPNIPNLAPFRIFILTSIFKSYPAEYQR